MTPLIGHESPETAYVVDDYPYGFRLRTQIRYWMETKQGHGTRFVSQTLNPKTGRWNKPKASTYITLRVMYLDSAGHIGTDGVSSYTRREDAEAFFTQHADALTSNYDREAIRYIRAAHRANDRMTWSVCTDGDHSNCNHQTIKEQASIVRGLIHQELWRDTIEAIEETSL